MSLEGQLGVIFATEAMTAADVGGRTTSTQSGPDTAAATMAVGGAEDREDSGSAWMSRESAAGVGIGARGGAACGRTCALAEMRGSEYCLAPAGVEGWYTLQHVPLTPNAKHLTPNI